MIVGLGIDLAPVARFATPLRDPGHPSRREMVERRRRDAILVPLTHTEDLAAAVVLMDAAAPTEVQE